MDHEHFNDFKIVPMSMIMTPFESSHIYLYVCYILNMYLTVSKPKFKARKIMTFVMTFVMTFDISYECIYVSTENNSQTSPNYVNSD